MIIYITPANRENYKTYLNQYFQLRKTVFCDELKWVKSKNQKFEKDNLDEEYNVTLLYIDEESDTVVGGLRLIPTTGNTLLHDVWVDMLPERDDFRSPNIWEATRFCTNTNYSNNRNNYFINRIFYALILATLKFSSENGITSIIAVCEKKFVMMFSAFNAALEIISEKTDENGCELCCTLWSTEPEIQNKLKWAKYFLGEETASQLEH